MGAWLKDVWPLPQQPDSCRQWFEQAARKPSWDVARAMAEVEGGSMPGDDQAWNAPFAQPCHRAALKAWPRVQQELAGVPVELLMQWAQERRLWLQAPAAERPVSSAQWQIAWRQVLPGLAHDDAAWRQTPHGSLVPVQSQGSAAAAVEYFAPSSAAQ